MKDLEVEELEKEERQPGLEHLDRLLNSSARSVGGPSNLGNQPIKVDFDALKEFTTLFFEKLGWSRPEASGAAEILVTSDVRNIESHGVPRLEMYLNMARSGTARPNAPFSIERETLSTALVDAGGGLGMVVGRRAMEMAIQKANLAGIGMVTVKNSSHFGIAGYYAEMALKHDMIGMAMTQSNPVGVPTNGRVPMLGSNPLALAAPTNEEYPFLLDMATTSVALGKVEIAARMELPVPEGWGLDKNGQPTTDPLTILQERTLTPLGSTSILSSHKGYGLQVMVDILCGVLSGMGHSFKVGPLQAGHFFCAMQVEAFRPIAEFRAEMDEMIRDLRATPPVSGAARVYVAGEKEYMAEKENLVKGVPLHPKVLFQLKQLSQELDIPFPFNA